jgi:hypothetical protein
MYASMSEVNNHLCPASDVSSSSKISYKQHVIIFFLFINSKFSVTLWISFKNLFYHNSVLISHHFEYSFLSFIKNVSYCNYLVAVGVMFIYIWEFGLDWIIDMGGGVWIGN